ncbi:MAG: DUF2723 domain-containing protein [candidate division Zixibacteria bacterium]|nr:DUF2723 domain-containing protein [candidate division Zixibacteria bacterium]
MSDSQFRRLQLVVGGLVTLFAFAVYAKTAAPTFSYWDCGEFVACANILGIPHPPGSPVFVLLGRVFTLLPIASDIAVRVNFLSVTTSAMAAGIAFFVLVRLILAGLLQGEKTVTRWQAWVALGGAVSGALFLAFSNTHWNNAVEAEVYGASMFLTLALAWLAMRWADRRHKPLSDRYLIAISYVALLSVGIHMTVYLAMPVIFLFIISIDPALRRNWRFWVSGIVLFFIAVDVTWFVVAGGLWLLISVAAAVTRRAVAGWGLIAAIMVAAWLGFSSQTFLLVRSTQDPNIDENDPETIKSFSGFLQRKQYGQTGMISRMFDRRGKWLNQFGDHAHMGFYRYFKEQYGFGGWAMVPVILVGFYGAFWLFRRAPPWGVMIFMLFFVGSVGLILYMNFADGTQYYRLNPDAYMEVRHRDYFFTPAYIVFGMMMGLGLAALAGRLGERGAAGRQLAVGLAIVAALLPLRTLQANWRGADRSRNFTPYDYAWNLLQSCKPNAILFTSGDNDTFPLWCIQEVYGVRKDVAIVNLSLAQTDWYIWQMKHMWGLPVTFTDDQILWSVPDRSLGMELDRPKEAYKDPVSGNRHYLFPTRDGGSYLPVNEMIVEHIVLNNKWERPIYFSSNPSDKSRLHLEKHCRVVGEAFEVVREDAPMDFDYPATASLMDSTYLYRGFDDPTIGLDDNAVGLAVAFPERMLALSDYYRRLGDTANSDHWANKARSTFPSYYRTHEMRAQQLRAAGDSTAATKVLEEGVQQVGAYATLLPDNRMYWYFWGKMCEAAGHDDDAEKYLAEAFWNNPNDQMVYQDYVQFLTAHTKTGPAARAAAKWLEYYPSDQRARSLVNIRRTGGG